MSPERELLSRIGTLGQELEKVQAPIVKRINALLTELEGRSFESWDEAVETVDAIKALVRKAGCHLFYDGKPVTIQCVSSSRSKMPSIQVRARVKGQQTAVRERISMPPLESRSV